MSLVSIETVWKRQMIWCFLFRTGGETEFFPYQLVHLRPDGYKHQLN